jgi:N4-gp56 family major capsid protein
LAQTTFGTNNPLAVKLWSRKLFEEMLKECWIGKFIGTDSNSVIQRKTETEKSPGDKVTIGLRMQLQGGGVQGDGTLEGNEEALTTYSMAVTIDQLRHAVRTGGRMSDQRIPFSVREEAMAGLRDWYAARIDYWGMNQLAGNLGVTDTRWTGLQAITAHDSNHVVYPELGDTNTTDQSLASTDIFTLNQIDRAVAMAKSFDVTGGLAGGPIINPGLVPIRPVRIGGEDKFVLFIHPYQTYQLRANTSTGQWLDIQKAAMTGGQVSKNPLYTGALGEYNGCIMHEAFRVPQGYNSSTNAAVSNVRRAILCGAQAAVMAFGQGNSPNKMNWVN